MIPDELARTTKIPIRIVDGQPQPFYGPTWPKLKDGAIGELTIPAYAFLNPQDEVLLSARLGTEIIPARTVLLAAVSDRSIGPGILRKNSAHLVVEAPYKAYIELRTEESLRIQLRGTKRARLERCRCSIVPLKEERDSVNEAYTRVSEVYETQRRSHTGNVFEKVMYSRADQYGGVYWSPLENLRLKLEAALEARFQAAQASAK